MTAAQNYLSVYEASASDPEKFWLEAAKAIDWITPPLKLSMTQVLLSTAGSLELNSTPVSTP